MVEIEALDSKQLKTKPNSRKKYDGGVLLPLWDEYIFFVFVTSELQLVRNGCK
jgi:hypothetical protein